MAAGDLAPIVLSKIEQLPVKQDVLDAATELRMRLTPVGAIHLARRASCRRD